ncbi:MAG: HhoA/HhoB/HtrA family serine endopeptidase [Leptolyngbyaceae cyanobacterium]
MGLALKQIGLSAATLLIGGGLGWAGHQQWQVQRPAVETPTAANSIVPAALNTAQQAQLPEVAIAAPTPSNPNFIADAVNQVGAAVVRIDAQNGDIEAAEGLDNPFFRRFFGDEMPLPQEPFQQGTGSGFIIATNGRIITNAHVVEGAAQVTVTLTDGRTFEGAVVGIDKVTDVAAIQIEAENLPAVVFGATAALSPGQWAIAIGNPLGLDNTVTAGIISALGRSSTEVGIPDKRVQFIQTDAAINPGNSGGPLLNDQGEVIGMNTAIRRDAQGLGFAIPVETFSRIAQQLFEDGEVQHPYLGIQMVLLNPEMRDRINAEGELNVKVDADDGVLIVRVLEDTPAAAGGLQAGDIIQQVNGKSVETPTDVQAQVDAGEIGQPLTVEILREGETQAVTVRPMPLPAQLQ